MLSRVADSLYWMSRYLERAEHTARLVNVNLNLTLDRAPADAARHWGRLLASLPAAAAGAGPMTSADAAERRHARPRQPRVDRRLHRRRARERAAGARADQLRDVGAAQPAVPRPCSGDVPDAELDQPARTSSSPSVIERRAPVPGRHRRDDDARRGLAVHRARPLSRARQRHRRAARRALPRVRRRPRPAGRGRRVRGVGRRCCGRAARSRRTAGTTPPTCGRAHRRVPAAERGLPALDPLRRRPHPGVAAGASRALHGPRRPRRAAGRPAARVARLRAGRRDHRRQLPGYLEGIVRQANQINARRPPAVHRLSDRRGAVRPDPCPTTRSATSPASPTTRRSARA